MIRFEIPVEDIKKLLVRQIDSLFSCNKGDSEKIENSFPVVIGKLEENFKALKNKYYNRDNIAYFNPFHSGQYCIFLYYMSRQIAHPEGGIGDTVLADKIYYLNKMMNSVDLFYKIELPMHFGLEHPLGTIMGRAKFGDYFYFYQQCTVGGTLKNGIEVYPIIGNNVQLCANSSILGDCKIGNNVIIGAGTTVKDQDIPDKSIVFGSSPNLIIKENHHNSLEFKL